jgi:hypothetical protein
MDLFDKIQSTLYKMKIPTMIGVTEQDVLKFEEEKIINPLFKKFFTEPLPNKTIVQMIKDSQHDTQNFADLVGINVDNIVNKEGVLDNGQFFPDNNAENNDYLENNEQELNFNSPDKKEDNIRLELIKKNNLEENLVDKNNLIWKKDKEFFEFDIPTYLEMTKEDNEEMTIDDIKKAFYKNLDKVNNDSVLMKFKQNLFKNKYNLGEQEFYEYKSIQKDIKSMNLFGYYFYGNGKDYFSYIKNELLTSGNSSDRKRYDIGEILKSDKLELNNESENPLNEYKGKTFNPVNNFEFNMDENSLFDLNSQVKKNEDSKSKNNEKNEKEQKISNEVINELNKIISKTKFYQNVKVETLVDNINENTIIIRDYTEKEKKSFAFYNLLISCQINEFNLQQNNLFSDFFFVKNN